MAPFIEEGVGQVLILNLPANTGDSGVHLRGAELLGVLQGEDTARKKRGPYPLLLIVQVGEVLVLAGIPGLVNRAPVVGGSELLPGLPGVGRKLRSYSAPGFASRRGGTPLGGVSPPAVPQIVFQC